jgi:hypothetical protein
MNDRHPEQEQPLQRKATNLIGGLRGLIEWRRGGGMSGSHFASTSKAF